MLKPLIIYMIIAFLTILLVIIAFVPFANAHEGHGYRHMDGTTGPCIGARHCPDGSQVWTIDDNQDGVADRCITLLFIHNKFHVKDKLLSLDGKCHCWGWKED